MPCCSYDESREVCGEGSRRKRKMAEEKDRQELAWELVSTEHVLTDEWIDFRKQKFRFPDGTEFEPYYTYSRRDYVVIVASDEEGRYLTVRQYRYGIQKVTTEFPAGGIERSDGKQYYSGGEGWEPRGQETLGSGEDAAREDALEAAKRELSEETGYTSDEWKHLITIASNATIADNYAHIYMARNCKKSTEQHLDETEYLNVELHTEEEIEKMISEGRFEQAIHVMAWMLALRN